MGQKKKSRKPYSKASCKVCGKTLYQKQKRFKYGLRLKYRVCSQECFDIFYAVPSKVPEPIFGKVTSKNIEGSLERLRKNLEAFVVISNIEVSKSNIGYEKNIEDCAHCGRPFITGIKNPNRNPLYCCPQCKKEERLKTSKIDPLKFETSLPPINIPGKNYLKLKDAKPSKGNPYSLCIGLNSICATIMTFLELADHIADMHYNKHWADIIAYSEPSIFLTEEDKSTFYQLPSNLKRFHKFYSKWWENEEIKHTLEYWNNMAFMNLKDVDYVSRGLVNLMTASLNQKPNDIIIPSFSMRVERSGIYLGCMQKVTRVEEFGFLSAHSEIRNFILIPEVLMEERITNPNSNKIQNYLNSLPGITLIKALPQHPHTKDNFLTDTLHEASCPFKLPTLKNIEAEVAGNPQYYKGV